MENALQPEENLQKMIAAERDAGLHPKGSETGRYHWRWVNFSLFLYDEVEDLHIPESVYRKLRKI